MGGPEVECNDCVPNIGLGCQCSPLLSPLGTLQSSSAKYHFDVGGWVGWLEANPDLFSPLPPPPPPQSPSDALFAAPRLGHDQVIVQ